MSRTVFLLLLFLAGSAPAQAPATGATNAPPTACNLKPSQHNPHNNTSV